MIYAHLAKEHVEKAVARLGSVEEEAQMGHNDGSGVVAEVVSIYRASA